MARQITSGALVVTQEDKRRLEIVGVGMSWTGPDVADWQHRSKDEKIGAIAKIGPRISDQYSFFIAYSHCDRWRGQGISAAFTCRDVRTFPGLAGCRGRVLIAASQRARPCGCPGGAARP